VIDHDLFPRPPCTCGDCGAIRARRERIATAVLGAIIGADMTEGSANASTPAWVASRSVLYADALIAELDRPRA
jgi:hypothetical protein